MSLTLDEPKVLPLFQIHQNTTSKHASIPIYGKKIIDLVYIINNQWEGIPQVP